MNIGFPGNLENLKRNVTETLLKFNKDVFSKHKKCIEKAKVELKKWVIEL